jgi:hypothetical protein
MIEADLLQYLQGNTALVTTLGGVKQICVIQAPATLKMPYATIEPIPGSRKQMGASKIEEITMVRISLDCELAKLMTGRTAINMIKALVENYRGDMNGADDLHITCSSIGGWSGLLGMYRFQFTATCRFVESLVKPVPLP